MGRPFMSQPKEDERIGPDWITAWGKAPSQFLIGWPNMFPKDWRRPDPDWEHPDDDEKVGADWLVRLLQTNTVEGFVPVAPYCVGGYIVPGYHTNWLRPKKKEVEVSTTSVAKKSDQLRIFLQSAHDPNVGLRGAWPEYD